MMITASIMIRRHENTGYEVNHYKCIGIVVLGEFAVGETDMYHRTLLFCLDIKVLYHWTVQATLDTRSLQLEVKKAIKKTSVVYASTRARGLICLVLDLTKRLIVRGSGTEAR